MLKRVGGTILCAGHVTGAALGILVRVANVDRENAVEDHVILAANETYSKLAP